MKGALEAAVVLQPQLANQTLGGEIAAGRVVLVQGVHGHAIGRGAGRLGQRGPKGILPLVGDADPVDRTEHDRLLRPQQHDAPAAQRQLTEPLHGS